MDKKNEGIVSRHSIFKNVLMFAVICLLSSCRTEIGQVVEFTENGYKANLNGVLISMSPTTVSVGEEVVIELSHKKNKKVEVEIESTSLSYKESFKTPASVIIKIETEGIHDISFTQKSFGTSMTSDAIIVCR